MYVGIDKGGGTRKGFVFEFYEVDLDKFENLEKSSIRLFSGRLDSSNDFNDWNNFSFLIKIVKKDINIELLRFRVRVRVAEREFIEIFRIIVVDLRFENEVMV